MAPLSSPLAISECFVSNPAALLAEPTAPFSRHGVLGREFVPMFAMGLVAMKMGVAVGSVACSAASAAGRGRNDVVRREFVPVLAVGFALVPVSLPPLRDHVPSVVARRAEEQVRGIAARRVVAVVTDEYVHGRRQAGGKNPRDTMRLRLPSGISARQQFEMAVAPGFCWTRPQPAFVRAATFDLRPKSLGRRAQYAMTWEESSGLAQADAELWNGALAKIGPIPAPAVTVAVGDRRWFWHAPPYRCARRCARGNMRQLS